MYGINIYLIVGLKYHLQKSDLKKNFRSELTYDKDSLWQVYVYIYKTFTFIPFSTNYVYDSFILEFTGIYFIRNSSTQWSLFSPVKYYYPVK